MIFCEALTISAFGSMCWLAVVFPVPAPLVALHADIAHATKISSNDRLVIEAPNPRPRSKFLALTHLYRAPEELILPSGQILWSAACRQHCYFVQFFCI